MAERHKIKVVFEAGYSPSLVLVCPEDGSCREATSCGVCGRALDVPEDEPTDCHDCAGITPEKRPRGCALAQWDDLVECVEGEVTVPVESVEWNWDEGPTVTVSAPSTQSDAVAPPAPLKNTQPPGDSPAPVSVEEAENGR